MFNNFAIVLAFITVVITLLYSIKSITDVYFGSFNGYKHYIKNLHYNGILINFPLTILSILSIYSGYIFNDLFIGINSNYLGLVLYIKSDIMGVIAEYYPYYRFYVLGLLIYFTLIYFYIRKYNSIFFFILIKNNPSLYNLHYSISKKYIYINRLFLYNNIKMLFDTSYIVMYKLIDKGMLEIFGPYGITYNLYN
jgi:NADH-ubiquinone oxidoreductase chain 5